MTQPFRRAFVPFVLGLVAAIAPMTVRAADAAPKPDTYLCPHATGGAVDCFLHAVEHLYTMCRQVKSIEIIEFGYEKSAEGTNGAKSEYCVDKHRLSITRPYQLALREATPSRTAVDGLRVVYDRWLRALAELKWVPGESDTDYKVRVAKPYEWFSEQSAGVRATLAASKSKTPTATAKAPRTKSAN
jgi:hypothetical protein